MTGQRPKFKISGLLLTLALLVSVVLFLILTRLYIGGEGVESPRYNQQAILLAVLTSINVLLILTLILILSRYLVRFFFEKHGRPFFASVKTKLTFAFMVLAIVPTGLFVFFSYEVINDSVNQWFSAPAEEILNNAEEVARAYLTETIDSTRFHMREFLEKWRTENLSWNDLLRFRQGRSLDVVMLMDEKFRIRLKDEVSLPGQSPDLPASPVTIQNPALLFQNLEAGKVSFLVENYPGEDVVLCFTPSPWTPGDALIFARRLPARVTYRTYIINEAYQEYFQLKGQIELIRLNYFFIIGFAGVILLFGFMWLGLFLSKRITTPIHALMEGSQRVARGDLAGRIQCEANDEFEVLIDSFNKMTEELQHNKQTIDRVNEELRRFNVELENRNAFIQTVMDTIATGVISVDPAMTVTISNPAAGYLLKQRRIQADVTTLGDILPADKLDEIKRLLQESCFHPRVSREITFQTGKRTLHFAVTSTMMKDPDGKNAGYVIVFDDVSELIRSEKAAAWQEVAKRLAHQIKNPLTPIQLMMERIHKQHRRLEENGLLPAHPDVRTYREILEEALQTVQSETRNLKYLVEEFSQFARLPAPNFQPIDLNQLMEEVSARYRAGRPDITFQTKLDRDLLPIYADQDLIRNVLVNLLDNAVEAIDEAKVKSGVVTLATGAPPDRQTVMAVVEDNALGITEEALENLFLPYFSTKEQGMGLGLTIVKKIIDDHDAGIRVEPVQPQGCRFVMEFRKLRVS